MRACIGLKAGFGASAEGIADAGGATVATGAGGSGGGDEEQATSHDIINQPAEIRMTRRRYTQGAGVVITPQLPLPSSPPCGTLRAVSRALAPLLLALLVACETAPPDSTPPMRLASRPELASVDCEQLARTTPGAAWQTTALPARARTPILLGDPSVVGGPFERTLQAELTGAVAVRVLVRGEGKDARALCVQARGEGGEPASWKPLGDVGIDTDAVVVGDATALVAWLEPTQAPVWPCLEGPAETLDRATLALATQQRTLVRSLPTLACLERPAEGDDRERLREALRGAGREGRFLLEPVMPAQRALRALASGAWATVPGGLVVESARGDGAYPARVGADAQGRAVVIELPL